MEKRVADPLVQLPQGTVLHDRYRRCALVNERAQADDLLEELADDHCDREDGMSWQRAMEIERTNIGYWAGCYLPWPQTMKVFRLFHTASPVFGDYHPEVHEAFWAGVRMALEMKGRSMLQEELLEMEHWTRDLHRWKSKGGDFPGKPSGGAFGRDRSSIGS